MITGDSLAARRRRRTIGVSVLLIAFALALPLEGSQLTHTHEADTAGIYNSDCPLAFLAAFHGAGLLPETPASGGIFISAVGVFIAQEQFSTGLGPRTDSRAPPLL